MSYMSELAIEKLNEEKGKAKEKCFNCSATTTMEESRFVEGKGYLCELCHGEERYI